MKSTNVCRIVLNQNRKILLKTSDALRFSLLFHAVLFLLRLSNSVYKPSQVQFSQKPMFSSTFSMRRITLHSRCSKIIIKKANCKRLFSRTNENIDRFSCMRKKNHSLNFLSVQNAVIVNRSTKWGERGRTL